MVARTRRKEPKRQGSSDCDQKLAEDGVWTVRWMDADEEAGPCSSALKPGALQCSDLWQSAAASNIVAPCAFVVVGNRGVLALAFACFPCVGVGMEGSRGARACQCPQRINRDRFHLPLCLRGEYRLNAQRKMQGLVDAKTLADGFDDAEDDAIQKNGQEANQGQMQKEWAIYFPGCSPSPVWALLPAAK